MNKLFTRLPLLLCVASLSIQIMASAARAQQSQGEAAATGRQEQAEDVLRITTELVQTDVTVFDKQGRFVDGLKKEDFELRVDGKPAEINFFERVIAGSVNEEAQLAAARGVARTTVESGGGSIVKPLDRGRIVAFYIDDLHMSFSSMKLARTTILNFIDKEMSQNDLVVIASASGRIGFLQQYTDNKEVLRAAVARVEYKSYDVRDMQRPPMTPYQAILIDRNETDVKSYFIEETLRQNPGMTMDMAESIVMGRVGNILSLAARNSSITLSTLESLARSSAPLPGRKLVFFISDGFFLDTKRSDTPERLRRIADAAARSGVVIYSMDSKGLVSGMPDASAEVVFDPSGRLQRATAGELTATQDVMNAIALDTGGRFVRNTNVLEPGLNKALKETSVYYLLAWRPDAAAQRAGKYRKIEVGVRNHPDATVRMQRGFFETTNKPEQKPKESGKTVAAKPPSDPLKSAIGALFPVKGLPTRLALSYMDIQNAGLTLVAAMKIEGGAVKFSKQADGKPAAIIDVAGTVLNSQGKQLDSFRERLTVTPTNPAAEASKLSDITYNFRSALKPGLYQVRVAARDQASGQVGSATQWLEVPDLSKQQLSMSSLIVGERKPGAATEKSAEKKDEELIEGVPLSVDRLFERSSHLRFVVYVYNAARGGTAGGTQPDVALQIQLLRDDQPVLTTPLRKLPTEAQDLARLAYAAEIPLQTMAVGQYVLQVTAIDRIAKTSASQRVKFEIQ